MLVPKLVLSALVASAAPAVQIFDYDASSALDLKAQSSEMADGVTVNEVTYASPKGGRVPATMVVPPGTGPFAGIAFMHWGEWESPLEGNRSEFLPEAIALARRGALSILIDAPFLRKEGHAAPPDDARTEAERTRDSYVGLVVDLRRAVDVLVDREDIDPSRLGYVGHGGIGATWGGTLAGVEPRLRALVLIAGVPAWPGLVQGHPKANRIGARRTEYAAALDGIAPLSHVARATPGSIFFQFGRHDRFVSPKAAAQYLAAAGGAHEVRWYTTGHDFKDDRATTDRMLWLSDRLKLSGWRPPPPEPTTTFEYAPGAPLDIKQLGVEQLDGLTVTDLTYASPGGGRVPAFVVAPATKGPSAGVIFMHWGQGDRTEFLGDALALAATGGLVSILVDAPHLRPEGPAAPSPDSRGDLEKERDYMTGLILDLRRAVDVLLARENVDRDRVGYVGHSIGASVGGVLAGVEPRIDSFVLVAGGIGFREGPMSIIAGGRYATPLTPGRILFQFGRRDRFFSAPAVLEDYTAAFGPDPEIRWYMTDHEFNDRRSAQERRDWLLARLGARRQ